jgi:hypothetical protein
MYRAASWWTRAYAPELSMGLSTADEMADIIDIDPDGSYTVTTEALRAAAPTTQQAETIAPAAPATEEAPQAGGGLYQTLFNRLNNASDPDVLDVIADEIREVFDSAEQAKLNALYQERRAALTGE